MFSKFLQFLPTIVACFAVAILVWWLCRNWFIARYVPQQEVRQLQDVQFALQNQYAALAERIKLTEGLLNEKKEKYNEKSKALIEAVNLNGRLKAQLENAEKSKQALGPGFTELELKSALKQVTAELLPELKNKDLDLMVKENMDQVKQNLQVLKADLGQLSFSSMGKQQELATMVWQLLEQLKTVKVELNSINEQIAAVTSARKGNEDTARIASIHKTG